MKRAFLLLSIAATLFGSAVVAPVPHAQSAAPARAKIDVSKQAQAALRGKESLTLNATLDYQACDAKICHNPESVPLSWTFTLRPLIFQRPGQ